MVFIGQHDSRHDRSTAEFMKKFYAQMRSGKGNAESLRYAKLQMLQDADRDSGYPAYKDPYYWAPFIMVGPGD